MSVADPQQSLLVQSLAAIFPLPLTPFEAFMVADDTAEYSMMADLEMHVHGKIDRAAFESALKFALQRNPLFTCLVESDTKGRLVWVLTNRMPEVEWVPLDAPLDDRHGARIDLTRDIGLRIWVRTGLDHSAILLNFHHACTDGIGTFGFFEDLLTAYATAYPGSPPIAPRLLEPERMPGRGEIGLAGRSLARKLCDAIAGVREGIKFFVQWPVPLTGRGPQSSESISAPLRPGFITRRCPADIASGLRQVASAHGATVNDVLLRDLFLVLRQWNANHGGCPRGCDLRILMPQNLRERKDSAMPAANVMSFAFVTRKARWCDRPAELLDSIHEETVAVRRGKLSLYFTGALASLQSAGLLRWALRTPMCFASAVLTNISDPTRRFTAEFPRCPQGVVAGNLVLETIVGVPPLRNRTRAAFSICNSSETLFITLRVDARHFTQVEAQQLLDSYLEQLENTAASAPAAAQQTAVQPTLS